MKGRIHIDRARCKGCGLCVKVCARRVLAMAKALDGNGQRQVQVDWPARCTGCGRCAEMCPEAGIEIEREPDPNAPAAAGGRVPAGEPALAEGR